MSKKINTPEFAQAWRFVSEALLEHFQQSGYDGETKIIEKIVDTIEPKPVQPKSKVLKDVRYAACPIRQSDTTYMFKNLKMEKQPESTFKISRYEDDSCEFCLCDMDVETRQILRDNLTERLPSAVGSITGEITADNVAHTIKYGVGVADGRSVRILEPMLVEFR